MILTALPDLETLLGRQQRDVLLRLGVTHGEESRVALAGASADGDTARVRREAHRLRGAVSPFGVDDLAAFLYRVESGEAIDAAAIDREVAAFTAACRDALG